MLLGGAHQTRLATVHFVRAVVTSRQKLSLALTTLQYGSARWLHSKAPAQELISRGVEVNPILDLVHSIYLHDAHVPGVDSCETMREPLPEAAVLSHYRQPCFEVLSSEERLSSDVARRGRSGATVTGFRKSDNLNSAFEIPSLLLKGTWAWRTSALEPNC